MGQQTYYGAVIQAKDVEHDVALLKIVDDVKVVSLPLGDSARVNIGETVYAVGNPIGFKGTFSEGLISGIRIMEGMRKIQFTAPISSGSSGGPLVNARGEVVGITSQTLTTAQNLNFAVPIGYFKPLLHNQEAQDIYESMVARDDFYTIRRNHREIDTTRQAISDGLIREVPGGITQWHSKYDPFDPKAQHLYEIQLQRGLIKRDYEIRTLADELLRRHVIHRVNLKS